MAEAKSTQPDNPLEQDPLIRSKSGEVLAIRLDEPEEELSEETRTQIEKSLQGPLAATSSEKRRRLLKITLAARKKGIALTKTAIAHTLGEESGKIRKTISYFNRKATQTFFIESFRDPTTNTQGYFLDEQPPRAQAEPVDTEDLPDEHSSVPQETKKLISKLLGIIKSLHVNLGKHKHMEVLIDALRTTTKKYKLLTPEYVLPKLQKRAPNIPYTTQYVKERMAVLQNFFKKEPIKEFGLSLETNDDGNTWQIVPSKRNEEYQEIIDKHTYPRLSEEEQEELQARLEAAKPQIAPLKQESSAAMLDQILADSIRGIPTRFTNISKRTSESRKIAYNRIRNMSSIIDETEDDFAKLQKELGISEENTKSLYGIEIKRIGSHNVIILLKQARDCLKPQITIKRSTALKPIPIDETEEQPSHYFNTDYFNLALNQWVNQDPNKRTERQNSTLLKILKMLGKFSDKNLAISLQSINLAIAPNSEFNSADILRQLKEIIPDLPGINLHIGPQNTSYLSTSPVEAKTHLFPELIKTGRDIFTLERAAKTKNLFNLCLKSLEEKKPITQEWILQEYPEFSASGWGSTLREFKKKLKKQNLGWELVEEKKGVYWPRITASVGEASKLIAQHQTEELTQEEQVELQNRVKNGIRHLLTGGKKNSIPAITFAIEEILLPAALKGTSVHTQTLIKKTSHFERPLIQQTIKNLIRKAEKLNNDEASKHALGFTVEQHGPNKVIIRLSREEYKPVTTPITGKSSHKPIEIRGEFQFDREFFEEQIRDWMEIHAEKSEDKAKIIKAIIESSEKGEAISVRSAIVNAEITNPTIVVNDVPRQLKDLISAREGIEFCSYDNNTYYFKTSKEHAKRWREEKQRFADPETNPDYFRLLTTRTLDSIQRHIGGTKNKLIIKFALRKAWEKKPFLVKEFLEFAQQEYPFYECNEAFVRGALRSINAINQKWPDLLGFDIERNSRNGNHHLRLNAAYTPTEVKFANSPASPFPKDIPEEWASLPLPRDLLERIEEHEKTCPRKYTMKKNFALLKAIYKYSIQGKAVSLAYINAETGHNFTSNNLRQLKTFYVKKLGIQLVKTKNHAHFLAPTNLKVARVQGEIQSCPSKVEGITHERFTGNLEDTFIAIDILFKLEPGTAKNNIGKRFSEIGIPKEILELEWRVKKTSENYGALQVGKKKRKENEDPFSINRVNDIYKAFIESISVTEHTETKPDGTTTLIRAISLNRDTLYKKPAYNVRKKRNPTPELTPVEEFGKKKPQKEPQDTPDENQEIEEELPIPPRPPKTEEELTQAIADTNKKTSELLEAFDPLNELGDDTYDDTAVYAEEI
ncbi:hypothetical protein HOE67_04040 [Candidatus Peregrinibacteria bacterium]|jgi:hypothetical protein|nr:hypothetical protein [Candidatus Peregrinibacteria bacterium]MBT4056256.1 hypothetical protein [Candidatus Peregrinibacteria bacterium]